MFWSALLLMSILLFLHHDKELDIPITFLSSFKLPYVISMVVLVVLFLTGLAGFLLVLLDEKFKKIFMAIFSSLLILLACLLSVLAYTEYINHDPIRIEYLSQFDDSILMYNTSSSVINNATDDHWTNDGQLYVSEDVDRIQSLMMCCGSDNYSDFTVSPWGQDHPDMVPESCCDVKAMAAANMTCRALNWAEEGSFIYQNGCRDLVEVAFLHWLDTLIVIQSFLGLYAAIALLGTLVWIRVNPTDQTDYEPLLED